MKKQILISLIIISSSLTMNAQWNGINPVWTTSNVGIGTGYAGVGIISPVEKLTIGEMGGNFAVQDRRTSTTEKYTSGYKFYDYNGESASILLEHNSYFGNNFRTLKFMVNGNEGFRISSNGFVGIGTINPAYKLDVCGTIRAKEIKVDLLGTCVPDFVFKKDYKLMSLKELEKFVTAKQHLPEIASEKEMIENGLNMKEFQMKLLQKMEEMTLYIIEQNKKNEKQEQELKMLNAKIRKLESKKR
ncbi:hypothetical protein GJU43_19020 [Flavobacterium sp. LC2016-23]|uniref:hypothetical protein n=1 Tax=Flavobacterium sp. LC2016-23 TaxID=2666330 RepID=UPI0012B09263|nr:hypothetical protein [Flavobacterium sp. LC2016-23]MRX41383.1 hypothetical protein [Flavobacterium sp. LC2016-23]